MIGFATDGAPVMRGINNSVLTLLREKVPQLFDIHCLSHCAALAAKKISKKFPQDIMNFIAEIYNWFSYSPKE